MESQKAFSKCFSSSKQRRLQLLYNDHELADCEFLVGDATSGEQRHFHCHKMLLATASEVFERMFYGGGKYMEHIAPVSVSEVSAEAFERFLRYVYIYEIDEDTFLPLKQLGELFYLADKYMMQDLTDALVSHLKKKHNWTLGDVWPMYDLACLHENLPLLLLCYEEITKYTERLLTVPSFYRINVNHLKRLMVLLSQQPHISTRLLFTQLEEYGRRNNLVKNRESEEFMTLVEAACQLDFNKLSIVDMKNGPSVSYLFNCKSAT